MTEVFRNLITNAVKYNDKAERLVEIGFLEMGQLGSGAERNIFYVKDNGIGIDPEYHQEIFRIFKRLQNASDGPGTGTGVGLTFVKKIVERHGGRIWLKSESGKGTVFYFSLNRRRNEAARKSHENSSMQSQSILLVEDNQDDYEATSRAFKKANLSNPIVWCKSGRDALNFLKREGAHKDVGEDSRPGLVLLDLNMPGMDGRKTLEAIKQDEALKRIPVIILTTSADERDIQSCYQTGANTYVQNPSVSRD